MVVDSSLEPNLEREMPSIEGEMMPVSPMPISLPTSPNLDDFDELMGQGLVDLAKSFDFELPTKGSDSMGTPPFDFPSLLSSVSTPSGGHFTSDIFDSFSMGVARVVTSEVETNTASGDQGSSLSSLPKTVSKGVKPSTDNERLSISLPSLPFLGSDVEPSTPWERGGSSMGD